MIHAQTLTKIYKLYDHPTDRMKEALHPLRKKYHHDFYALRDINFHIKKGETVGIIGQNGAGKSTLLKILTGVLTPSSGTYQVNGKIASLLELGTGFNPELSGLENVYFNGTILGYSKQEMDQKLQAILDFADIGEFIHQPVKSYSSGMYIRLAFAVAINVDPEVLIVDEALSVGDIRFQLKCFRKLREIQEKGTTILFVTHDMGAVINYCSRAIWLHDGQVKDTGSPDAVCKKYSAFMAYDAETEEGNTKQCPEAKELKEKELLASENQKIPWQSVEGCSSFGEGGAKIEAVAFYLADTGEKIFTLEGGEKVGLAIKIKAFEAIESPIIGFLVTDEYGNKILASNNYILGNKIKKFNKKEQIILEFKFRFPFLKNGDYSWSVAFGEGSQDNHIVNQWVNDIFITKMANKERAASLGMILIIKDIEFNLI